MAHSLAMWPEGNEVVGGATSFPEGFTVWEGKKEFYYFIHINENLLYTIYSMKSKYQSILANKKGLDYETKLKWISENSVYLYT